MFTSSRPTNFSTFIETHDESISPCCYHTFAPRKVFLFPPVILLGLFPDVTSSLCVSGYNCLKTCMENLKRWCIFKRFPQNSTRNAWNLQPRANCEASQAAAAASSHSSQSALSVVGASSSSGGDKQGRLHPRSTAWCLHSDTVGQRQTFGASRQGQLPSWLRFRDFLRGCGDSQWSMCKSDCGHRLDADRKPSRAALCSLRRTEGGEGKSIRLLIATSHSGAIWTPRPAKALDEDADLSVLMSCFCHLWT